MARGGLTETEPHAATEGHEQGQSTAYITTTPPTISTISPSILFEGKRILKYRFEALQAVIVSQTF